MRSKASRSALTIEVRILEIGSTSMIMFVLSWQLESESAGSLALGMKHDDPTIDRLAADVHGLFGGNPQRTCFFRSTGDSAAWSVRPLVAAWRQSLPLALIRSSK
jgi:hypothetical protein